jgi:hypothetical protein
MKYSLRSLMIVGSIAPPLLAAGYFLGPELLTHEEAPAILLGVGSLVIFGILAPTVFRKI